MKKSSTLALLALISTAATAQANDFEGLNVALGLAYVHPQINYTDDFGAHYQWDKNDTVAQLSATYNFVLSKAWLLGVGAGVDLGTTDAGIKSEMWGPVKATMKEHANIYIQPAYILDNTSTVFAKIGYHTVQISTPPEPGAGWIEDKFHVDGVGYGIGYNKFISNNLFFQAEIQQVDYKDKKISGGNWFYTQKSTSGVISLGYKF